MAIWKRRESQRNESRRFWRPRATKLKFASVWLGVLIVASASVFPSIADARTPPRRHRQTVAHVIQEVFERFFFAAWLGEPMSLIEGGTCPQAQILAALGDKSRFPDSFRRRVPDPKIASDYCGGVAIALKQEVLQFSLIAPKVSDCADYLTRWRAFLAATDTASAIQRYPLSDRGYEKYGIPLSGQSFYVDETGAREQRIERATIEQIRRFQVQSSHEQAGFCQFDFVFRESN
jgi:hypothetical protein